jgi:hypothetical protein
MEGNVMVALYTSIDVWLGIILGGLAGCLGLWVVLYALARVPFKALGGHPGKLLWSVLFMIPAPFLLGVFGNPQAWIISLAWLAVAPTAATKFYFGPKTAKWGKTIGFNAIYGVVALVVFMLVVIAV